MITELVRFTCDGCGKKRTRETHKLPKGWGYRGWSYHQDPEECTKVYCPKCLEEKDEVR